MIGGYSIPPSTYFDFTRWRSLNLASIWTCSIIVYLPFDIVSIGTVIKPNNKTYCTLVSEQLQTDTMAGSPPLKGIKVLEFAGLAPGLHFLSILSHGVIY
jgi:hypothetical protein